MNCSFARLVLLVRVFEEPGVGGGGFREGGEGLSGGGV